MKALSVILAGLLCAAAQAATSDILFQRGGGSFAGAAGNVLFNGQQFVTPTVQSNGAIGLVFLDTNGVAISNLSLSITGNSPRIVSNGSDYLLAWLNTNAALPVLNCARISSGVIGTVSALGTNVANETISLSGKSAPFVVIWQSADSNSVVLARTLDSNGTPAASSFAVSSSAQSQRNPSVDTDGTNFLACWMEQNVASNDWRVVARVVNASGPLGSVAAVSETNSLRAYPTACSFGTNYLVAWSWDEGPIPSGDGTTFVWFPMIHGRMLSSAGEPQSASFSIARCIYTNTDPAIAFGDGHYFLTWANQDAGESGVARAQSLAADGTRHEYPIPMFRGQFKKPQMAFGHGRFLGLYPDLNGSSLSVMFDHDTMTQPTLVNLRRTNDSIAATTSISPSLRSIEVSTNLVDWSPRWTINGIFYFAPSLEDLPAMGGERRLFVRLFDRTWQCIEQLRGWDWAKQQWAVDNNRSGPDSPTVSDLVGPTRYLYPEPSCPHGGTYSINHVETKPTCSWFLNHTL